jgi:chromosome segregation ATPase
MGGYGETGDARELLSKDVPWLLSQLRDARADAHAYQELYEQLAREIAELRRVNRMRCDEVQISTFRALNAEAQLRDARAERDDLRTRLAAATAKLAAVRSAIREIADEASADIPEDAGNATAHLIAKHLRRALAAAEQERDEAFGKGFEQVRRRCVAAEERADRAEAALAAVRELLNENERHQVGLTDVPLIRTRAVRSALAAAEQDEPKPACSTCDGSGAVLMEHQIGVPGSGGWISCPDCRPTLCVPVSQPTEGSEQ